MFNIIEFQNTIEEISAQLTHFKNSKTTQQALDELLTTVMVPSSTATNILEKLTSLESRIFTLLDENATSNLLNVRNLQHAMRVIRLLWVKTAFKYIRYQYHQAICAQVPESITTLLEDCEKFSAHDKNIECVQAFRNIYEKILENTDFNKLVLLKILLSSYYEKLKTYNEESLNIFFEQGSATSLSIDNFTLLHNAYQTPFPASYFLDALKAFLRQIRSLVPAEALNSSSYNHFSNIILSHARRDDFQQFRDIEELLPENAPHANWIWYLNKAQQYQLQARLFTIINLSHPQDKLDALGTFKYLYEMVLLNEMSIESWTTKDDQEFFAHFPLIVAANYAKVLPKLAEILPNKYTLNQPEYRKLLENYIATGSIDKQKRRARNVATTLTIGLLLSITILGLFLIAWTVLMVGYGIALSNLNNAENYVISNWCSYYNGTLPSLQDGISYIYNMTAVINSCCVEPSFANSCPNYFYNGAEVLQSAVSSLNNSIARAITSSEIMGAYIAVLILLHVLKKFVPFKNSAQIEIEHRQFLQQYAAQIPQWEAQLLGLQENVPSVSLSTAVEISDELPGSSRAPVPTTFIEMTHLASDAETSPSSPTLAHASLRPT